MTRSAVWTRLFVGLLLAAVPVGLLAAQSRGKAPTEAELAAAKPGRNPNQPLDEEYTKRIKQYTTESFFLSPLVDYMPAAKGIPTPMAVLGDIAGAEGHLPYSSQVYEYMRLLAKSTPRVKVYSIGTTEEGREMIAVAVASEALMAKLDQNKADLAKLADPRSIQMNDAAADEIAKRAAPVYYITGTIHSTEAGAPTALMELAYRLAADDSLYIQNIRDHVITLITPIVEVDGRDRVVDIYNYKKKHPDDAVSSVLYWGHYVAHDNNRDAMGLTLKLSQNVLNTYLDWKAQVLHDLHESGSFLYDNTIGDGPYNAWLDPILTNEWQLIGWNNVNEMTRMGMPGVFAFGTFDTWSPGYLMFMAATHNGISRLYETFGNGGTADTEDRTLSANETSRTWYRQNPPLPRVKWSLRNNNNYEMTGLLVSLDYIANNRLYFLRNFYDKSKRSILKARTEGPAAYVLPASDPRLGSQAELLRVLQKQAVEISRATSSFTVSMPVRRSGGGGGGRGGRGGRGGGAGGGQGAQGEEPATPPAPPMTTREFPAGSYIVRMDQPYSRIADALLDYQYLGAERPAAQSVRRHGLDVPRRLWRAGRSRDGPEGARRARGAGPGRRGGAGRRIGRGHGLCHRPQRGERPDHAALSAEGRRHPDGGGAVRGGGAVVQPRFVHHLERQRRRSERRHVGTRPEGVRPLVGAVGQDAPGARGARRDPPRLGQHADRGLVAAGVRRVRHPVRLHRLRDGGEDGEPAREVRRHRGRAGAGRQQRHRRHAHVAQPDAVEELARDAEHRHLGADRRHPAGNGTRGPDAPRRVRP